MEAVQLDTMSGQQCADALVVEVAAERASDARRLLLIAQWAMLHNADSIPPATGADGRPLAGRERARTYGGDGTPEVAEFAVAELATLQGLPVTTAGHELGDVLDLIHRHPLLWARLQATTEADRPGHAPALAVGLVQAWQATWVARRCRNADLCRDAARLVDEQTTPSLGRLPWSTFQAAVDAWIKKADPELAERRRLDKEASKRVTVSRTNDEGMKTLTVQLPAAQTILLKARIHQLALILRAHGAQAALAQLEADAAFELGTNPLQALLHLIDGATPDQQTPATEPQDRDPQDSDPADTDPADSTEPAPGTHPEPQDDSPADDPAAEADEPADQPAATTPASGQKPELGPRRHLRPVPDLPADPDPEQDSAQARDLDDPRRLFDDRPVRGYEPTAGDQDPPPRPWRSTPRRPGPDPGPRDPGPPGPARDPDDPGPPDPGPDDCDVPGLLPESAIHPSQRDHPCPACGHDPTVSGENAALGAALRLLARADLTGLDPAKLRPTAILYLHSNEAEFRCGTGTMRFENDGTAFTQREAIDILGHTHVKITRVIDLADHQPADCHEVPDRLAEQVRLLHPTEVFPYSPTSSRAAGIDLDHPKPYRTMDAGGPPGQTNRDNLAPLHRGSHRVKTHGRGWSTRNPRLGLHLWRTPHGYCFQRDPSGTIPLGKMTHTQFEQYTHELTEHLDWDDELDDDTGTA